jgi:hypothetical protein
VGTPSLGVACFLTVRSCWTQCFDLSDHHPLCDHCHSGMPGHRCYQLRKGNDEPTIGDRRSSGGGPRVGVLRDDGADESTRCLAVPEPPGSCSPSCIGGDRCRICHVSRLYGVVYPPRDMSMVHQRSRHGVPSVRRGATWRKPWTSDGRELLNLTLIRRSVVEGAHEPPYVPDTLNRVQRDGTLCNPTDYQSLSTFPLS